MDEIYITTAIPYVNGKPHLGHALELVQADALARHYLGRGNKVRVQSGTDDHALKNVSAANAAGVGVAEFVDSNGDQFFELARALGVHTDEFLRTSSDPRHRAGVRALWERCLEAGDLYQRDYTGLYCAGCEQFYSADELVDGTCVEHGTKAQEVTETNWFFRLSRYRDQITELIAKRILVIEPPERRNEVLGFLRGEVGDLSVSRPAARAGGWGIAVPGDPEQVIYVWFDALANYISGLGFAGADESEYERWWESDTERIHVIGKGIVRFHAVYWVAFLLSAGLALPTKIFVHDYLSVGGDKIAKSGAQAAEPGEVLSTYGVDALRWWLLRNPVLVGTTDFTEESLVASYNSDLANSIGNLVSRTLALARRERTWQVSAESGVGEELKQLSQTLASRVDAALARYDLRAGAEEILAVAGAANRFIDAQAPWKLTEACDAGDAQTQARFVAVIDAVLIACSCIATELEAFVPEGARRLIEQLSHIEQKSEGTWPRVVGQLGRGIRARDW